MDLPESLAPNSGTCFVILRRFVILPPQKRCVGLAVQEDAGLEEWAAECTVYGMRRHWVSIVVITASVPAVTFGQPPNPDLRAEELYQRTEFGRAIDVLQALDERDAAVGQSVVHARAI